AVLARVLRVAPTGWRYELVGTQDAPDPQAAPGGEDAAQGAVPGTFVAHVRLHYRLGADTRDVRRDQYLTVVPRADGWYLAGDDDPRTEPAPWDLGDLTVRRGR